MFSQQFFKEMTEVKVIKSFRNFLELDIRGLPPKNAVALSKFTHD